MKDAAASFVTDMESLSPSSPTSYPMENDHTYRHGRVDPGVEENFDLVESVPYEKPQDDDLQQRNDLKGVSEVEAVVCVTQKPPITQPGTWRISFL